MDAGHQSGTLCVVSPSMPPEDDRHEAVAPIDSIGAYLAAQRRLRGISVEELAAQTRIPLRSLERLEAGSFDADVDGFVRGFVRTVADALGLDPEETLNRTLSEPAGATPRVDRRLSLQRVAITLMAAAAVGAVAGLVQTLAVSPAGPPSPSRAPEERVLRRDPVRALAAAQGVESLSAPAVLPARAPRVAAAERAPSDAGAPSASPAGDARSDP